MTLVATASSNAEEDTVTAKPKTSRAPLDFHGRSTALELSPGVRAGTSTIRTAEDAAAHAVALAEEAGKQGTFAIGGLLVDDSGRVIAEATNAVIRNGHLSDPTAHVERQLVDWFAHERRRGLSLSPRNVTIVSSLDPCAMCAGAILRSRMRVVIVAEDKVAGVHDDLKPRHVPPELQGQAQKDMAFFGVQGKRPRPAEVVPIFASDVSAEHVARSTEIFSASVKEVQQKVGGGGSGAGPRTFEPTERMFSNLREVAAQLGPLVKIGKGPLNVHELGSRHELMKLLGGDGSVLVDEDGNVIVASKGAETLSRARTSVLELIRAYTFVRGTMNDRFNIVLPHQSYCSVVKRAAPSEPAKGLLELGATGSFLELKRPTNKLPAIGYMQRANLTRAQEFAASLPQLYHDIGITVGQIGGS
jgi:tRNA(Arg) A34 adenosine deaminase TadA